MEVINMLLICMCLMDDLANETILELDVVHMIDIKFSLWPPFQIWLNSITSQIKLNRVVCFPIFSYFFCVSWSFARPQAKTHVVKFRLLLIETLISDVSWIFFLLLDNISNSDYSVCYNLSTVAAPTKPTANPFSQMSWV